MITTWLELEVQSLYIERATTLSSREQRSVSFYYCQLLFNKPDCCASLPDSQRDRSYFPTEPAVHPLTGRPFHSVRLAPDIFSFSFLFIFQLNLRQFIINIFFERTIWKPSARQGLKTNYRRCMNKLIEVQNEGNCLISYYIPMRYSIISSQSIYIYSYILRLS